MRKIISSLVSIILILTVFTACSHSDVQINDYWGASIEETLSGFGLSAEDAVIEESNIKFSNYFVYTFSNVKILGQKCELRLEFTGYDESEPVYSGCFFVFGTKQKAVKLYEKLTQSDGYVEIGESGGFGTLSDLTEEQIAWLEKYTAFVAGKEGFMLADTMPKVSMDGTTVRRKVKSFSAEMPLVELELINNNEIHMVRMSDLVYNLLASKEAQETLYPDGMPVSEELQEYLNNR